MMFGVMGQLGQLIATGMFIWAILPEWFHQQFRQFIEKYFIKLIAYVSPYITIKFDEYNDEYFQRSKAYAAIERYLSANSSDKAKRLKANVFKNCKSVVLSMDDYEEVIDKFNGVTVWWTSCIIIRGRDEEERRHYRLTCHRKDRDFVTKVYVKHVLDEGEAIALRSRQRKLYTNNKSESIWDGYRKGIWSSIVFEHPSTFDTLAMDPKKKKDILDDLLTFSGSRDYYKKIGKSWKRGYLLYGPPGTGKSSMIAAMANLLEYDIYDLELASVKNNTDLRKLLIETSSKSIIVIEDIDCSLDITGQRKDKKEGDKEDEKKKEKKKKKDGSEVTLSGLLNFIDGLWSACGSERLIVFTTNHVEKLDPALIRRGRMDKHIEMSYCCFETFKVLAKNYLDIESHDLFETIGRMLGETKMTPADVAENLMPKSNEEVAEICLKKLIKSLEVAKDVARLKAAMKDERIKAEEEEEEAEVDNSEEEEEAEDDN